MPISPGAACTPISLAAWVEPGCGGKRSPVNEFEAIEPDRLGEDLERLDREVAKGDPKTLESNGD